MGRARIYYFRWTGSARGSRGTCARYDQMANLGAWLKIPDPGSRVIEHWLPHPEDAARIRTQLHHYPPPIVVSEWLFAEHHPAGLRSELSVSRIGDVEPRMPELSRAAGAECRQSQGAGVVGAEPPARPGRVGGAAHPHEGDRTERNPRRVEYPVMLPQKFPTRHGPYNNSMTRSEIEEKIIAIVNNQKTLAPEPCSPTFLWPTWGSTPSTR